LRQLSDALSLTAIDDPIAGDEVLDNPTTEIKLNRGRPTKSLIRSAADARETPHTVSHAPRDLAGHHDSKALLTSAPDVTPMATEKLLPSQTSQEAGVRNITQYHWNGTAKRCAICDGRFGLARHYVCRTALCSRKCADRFRIRRDDDRRWLHLAQAA